MRAWGIVVLALITACSSTVLVDPPALGNGASIVLLISRAGMVERVIAMDRAAALPVELEEGTLDLTVLEMRCPLEAIGLTSPGEQTLRAAPHEKSVLPDPLAIYRATVEGDETSAWTTLSLEELPSAAETALRRLDLPADNLCSISTPKLRARDISLTQVATSSAPTFGIPLDDDTALLALASGTFLKVSRQGASIFTQLSTSTPHHAGFRGFDGKIFFVSDEGVTMETGDLRSFRKRGDARFDKRAQAIVRLAGPDPQDNSVEEFFSVTDARLLERFHADQYAQFAEAPRVPIGMRSLFRPSVAWVLPNDAVAVRMDEKESVVVHWRTGTLHKFDFGDTIPSEVATVRGFGTVLGTTTGELSFLDGFEWSDPTPILEATITNFYGLESSLLVCGVQREEQSPEGPPHTLCSFYLRGGRTCPTELDEPRVLRHLVKVDDETILMSFIYSTSDNAGTVAMSLIDVEDDVPDCIKN